MDVARRSAGECNSDSCLARLTDAGEPFVLSPQCGVGVMQEKEERQRGEYAFAPPVFRQSIVGGIV